MLNKQALLAEIERLTSTNELVGAYEEIAATRMRKIRASVLKNREFLYGLAEVYQQVQMSYKEQLLLVLKKKHKSGQPIISRNGKTVALLISANTGLYGDLVKKTYRVFIEYLQKKRCDVAIIGRLGKVAFQQQYPQAQCSYFDFPDTIVDQVEIKKIGTFLLQYEQIIIFYPQFKSIVSQDPTVLDIYGNVALAASGKEKEKEKYIFEPSIEKVVEFFENEIVMSIFEQIIYESNLAKFAARIFTLDKASVNISSELKKLKLEQRIYKHRQSNKKQLDALSGISLWG